MNRLEEALREFHWAFGLPKPLTPTSTMPDHVRKLRESLIEEEFKEWKEALDSEDLAQIVKEGIDLLYVVIGALVTYGIPIDEVFEEVHRSNMSKLGEDGKPVKREDGKVLKGPHYFEADVGKVLKDFRRKEFAHKFFSGPDPKDYVYDQAVHQST